MNDVRKNIRRVFWMLFTMFAVAVLYLLSFILVQSNDIINSSLNPRVRISRGNVKRGDILDRNGLIIAESIPTENGYQRIYNFDNMFSHVVGFIDMGNSGIEERYNFELQNLSLEIYQRLRNIAEDVHLQGDNLVLTLDGDLQKFIYNALGRNRGSIVVIEPTTGEILAMASYPNFNPNEINANWSSLSQDAENSPLLNRATQGLYAPGSVFKIVTSVAGMKHLENFDDFIHECTGSIYIEGNIIRCYNNTAHGRVDMVEAFSVSCNTYFVALAEAIGMQNLINVAESLYFNELIPFRLANSISRIDDQNDDISELMQASIGQGRVLATPMHMAMLAGAIANDGVMMRPHVVGYAVTAQGMVRNLNSPRALSRVFTSEENSKLYSMMLQAVSTGTGVAAAVPGVRIGGKTGTAENNQGEAHGWFVAFATDGLDEESQIALVVMLENAGNASGAVRIARDIINFSMRSS